MRSAGRVACAWLALVLHACVLPGFDVSGNEDYSGGVSSVSGGLSGASDECRQCDVERCQAKRDACGAACDDYTWPVSPVWSVSDAADEYVRCLAEQCETQCETRWGCVNNYSIPTPSESSYTVTIHLQDAATKSVADARVSACQSFLPSCTGDGLASEGTTDKDGNVQLQLDQLFFGYFLIDTGGRAAPTTFKPSQPIYRVDREITVILLESDFWAATAGSLGLETIDPEGSNLLFRANNCLPYRYTKGLVTTALAAAEDVSVDYTAGAGSRVFYTSVSLGVDPRATSTQPGGGGFGGALDLTPGQVSVNARYQDGLVGTAQLTLASGGLGFVLLFPAANP